MIPKGKVSTHTVLVATSGFDFWQGFSLKIIFVDWMVMGNAQSCHVINYDAH